jgi:hypothetical protein
MKLHRLVITSLFVPLLLVLVSVAPLVSADQGSVTLGNGEIFSKQIKMDPGHTMYTKYESSNPLVFMVVDPDGNIIRTYNSTYDGEFIEAKVGGNYTLVWQSTSPASTSLTYDYSSDVVGFSSSFIQIIVIVAIVVASMAIVVLVRRRKQRFG